MAPALLKEARSNRAGSTGLRLKTTDRVMGPNASMLVIDDDANTRQALAILLRALGVKQICQADSAENAMGILAQRSFSMIISDYQLGGMDGVELLEQLRARGDQTPMLLVSGAPDKTGVLRATRHPKADCFGKPFAVDQLVGAIERLTA